MPGFDRSQHLEFAKRTEISAQRVLKHVFGVFEVDSIVEVGCGFGHWTKEAVALGVEDALGIDGPWTSAADLVIPPDRFVVTDLERPFDLGRRFGLLLTLEVAEHLDRSASDTFVQSLVRHSDIILFSAAIPMQGGFKHVNEQWPSYWIPKFAAQGFRAFDMLRPVFWHDAAVSYWYRQNMLVFVNELRPDAIDVARAELARVAQTCWPMDIVHPDPYQIWASYKMVHLRRLLPRLPSAFLQSALKRFTAR